MATTTVSNSRDSQQPFLLRTTGIRVPSIVLARRQSAQLDLLRLMLAYPAHVLGTLAPPALLATESSARTRIHMDVAVLGFGEYEVEVDGVAYRSHTVSSERREDDETFQFQVGDGPRLLSVMTTFYYRPALGHIIIEGRMYFISSEAGHYVIAPISNRRPAEEMIDRAPVGAMVHGVAVPSPSQGRRRACCSSGYRAVYQGVLARTYISAVGNEQLARDRMVHMFAYTNTALWNSGYDQGRFYLATPVVRDLGVAEQGNMRLWAAEDTEIQAKRAAVHGCGTFIAAQKAQAAAPRNFPGKIDPRFNNARVSGFFAAWDDGDIQTAAHELGHTVGMDHNDEDAMLQSQDPQPFARAWYDCSLKARDLMSYNRCGDTLTTIGLYSGLKAVWSGITLGVPDVRDNIRAASNVFPFLDISQIKE